MQWRFAGGAHAAVDKFSSNHYAEGTHQPEQEAERGVAWQVRFRWMRWYFSRIEQTNIARLHRRANFYLFCLGEQLIVNRPIGRHFVFQYVVIDALAIGLQERLHLLSVFVGEQLLAPLRRAILVADARANSFALS